jgi:hypothetical protein
MTNLEATPPTQELPITPQPAPNTEPAAVTDAAAQRRYRALAAAIRRHELVASNPSVPKRPADHALYGQLAALEKIPPIPGDEPR